MRNELVKSQVQLTKRQYLGLKKLSRERDISLAALIREVVEYYLARGPLSGPTSEQKDAALKVVGKFKSGARDVATKHDAYLEDIFST